MSVNRVKKLDDIGKTLTINKQCFCLFLVQQINIFDDESMLEANLSDYPPVLPTPHFPDSRFLLDIDNYFQNYVNLK